MQRTTLRALAAGLLFVALGTAAPIAPAFAGAGSGGNTPPPQGVIIPQDLLPGQCFYWNITGGPNAGKYLVAIGTKAKQDNLPNLSILKNLPEACVKGGLTGPDIPNL